MVFPIFRGPQKFRGLKQVLCLPVLNTDPDDLVLRLNGRIIVYTCEIRDKLPDEHKKVNFFKKVISHFYFLRVFFAS